VSGVEATADLGLQKDSEIGFDGPESRSAIALPLGVGAHDRSMAAVPGLGDFPAAAS
jgi:hypothetical protein